MDAGLLRNLVTFQQYVEGFDEIGNPSHTWKDYKKDYAYTMLDVTGDVTEETIASIQAQEEVIRVRVIR